MDKTGRTGSKAQLINGFFLLAAFFGVRIVYGGKVVRLVAYMRHTLSPNGHISSVLRVYVYTGSSKTRDTNGICLDIWTRQCGPASPKLAMVCSIASVPVYCIDIYVCRFYKMISALRKRFASDEREKLLRTGENGHDREENGCAEQNGHPGNGVAAGYGTN